MPLDITFKTRLGPTLTIPVTTLDQAIFNEMIKYFDLTRDQYKEILDNVKEHYPHMIMREENDDDELMNETMKKYLGNVNFDNSEIVPAKRLISGREGIVKENLTSVRPSESCPVVIEENKAKYKKVCTVIDLTDEFNTTGAFKRC